MVAQPRIIDAEAPTIEMVQEPAKAQLPAPVDIDRLAKMSPPISGHAPHDDRLVAELAALGDDERCATVIRLAQRQAIVARSIAAHEGKRDQGLLQDAMLSHYWASVGGLKRLIAVRATTWLGLEWIDSVEVWECRDKRWRGYAWAGKKRSDITDSYPEDFPIAQALHGARIIQGIKRVDRPAANVDVRLTTADHALHDLQRPGTGIRTFKQFMRAYNTDTDWKTINDDLDKADLADKIASKRQKSGRWRALGLSIAVPVAVMAFILAVF